MSFDPVSFELVGIDHFGNSRLSIVTIHVGGVPQRIYFEGASHKERSCELYKRLKLYDGLFKAMEQLYCGSDSEYYDEAGRMMGLWEQSAYALYGGPRGTPIETTDQILERFEASKKEEGVE